MNYQYPNTGSLPYIYFPQTGGIMPYQGAWVDGQFFEETYYAIREADRLSAEGHAVEVVLTNGQRMSYPAKQQN